MTEKNNTFYIINDNGEPIRCDILFTFESEETGKNYIVYTDNSYDEEGNIQVFASVYNPELEDQKLQPVETEKEWRTIDKILNTLQETVRSWIEEAENRNAQE